MIETKPSTSVRIRKMTLDDMPTVMRIDRLSFPIPWSENSYRYELIGNPASLLLVAETIMDGRPVVVGYIGYWLIVDEVHISTIAVHPDHRGRGTGRDLMRTALKQAAQQGADVATLEVRVSNRIAQEMYRKFGFRPAGHRKGYYHDNGEDALLMTLTDLRRWRMEVDGGRT